MTLPLRLSSRFFKCLAIIGWPLALLVALVLPGCSAIRLGYNSAPEVSYWWLDSYLDFNSEQALKVRADLNAVQSWHRQKELPLYVTTLEKLQTMASGQVTPEQMCEVYAGLRVRFQTLVEQTEPLISAIAPTLKPEQLDHLARQLDKRSVKWRPHRTPRPARQTAAGPRRVVLRAAGRAATGAASRQRGSLVI